MKKGTEILAPAGSYEALVAAVNAGADAVYIGGAKFGARASAKSVSSGEDIIIAGIDYAHHFGVKVYLTVNILLKEKEIEELYDYILPYYKAGIDALIVQDLGVLKLLHELFPNVEKHASTQMSTQAFEAVDILKKYGVTRIVPARELSSKEIKEIYDKTGIEIESFVHGALCYSYSGQCLMSSLIGGRSGNRGSCAQTCRLEYNLYDENDKQLNKKNEKSLLSCKDLCSLDILPEIIESGVYSLKIEGRMKSSIYTAGVVSIWRKYVDMYYKLGREGYKVNDRDKRLLLDLFDRGGHTLGYYEKHNGRDMIALSGKPKERIINEEFNKYLSEKYVETTRKIALKAKISLKAGRSIKIKVTTIDDFGFGNIEVNLEYGNLEYANNRAATKEDIEKQILKTGNTLYEFKELYVDLEDGLFIPVKLLNELRRLVLEEVDKKILNKYRRKEVTDKTLVDIGAIRKLEIVKKEAFEDIETYSDIFVDKKSDSKKTLNILCDEKEQIYACINFLSKEIENLKNKNYDIEISYQADTLDPSMWKEMNESIKDKGMRVNLYMPHIFRTHARKYFEANKENLKNSAFDAFILRNIEELGYLNNSFEEKKFNYIFDYTIYGMNSISQALLEDLGADRQTLPVELNLSELSKLYTKDKELIVYGRLPMMVTAGCLRKNILSCDKKSSLLYLKDRMGKDMPVKNRCKFCYNTILNSLALSVIGIGESIKRLDAKVLRLMFTTENEKEIKKILKVYINYFINEEECEEPVERFTRGHFKRGIE